MATSSRVTREDLRLMHEQLCEQARGLMKLKNADYATSSDPFRNFRTFEELGILVRMSDKLARLRSFCETKQLAVKSEGVRDTILDLINYAVLLHGYLVDSGALQPDAPAASTAAPDQTQIPASRCTR